MIRRKIDSDLKRKKIGLLEISGDPYERGNKLGTIKKDAIGLLVQYLYKDYSSNNESKKDILEHAKEHIPFIKEYSPKIFEEIQGIADGSKRKLEEIIMIHMHEERSGFSSHNCTTYASTGQASADYKTYIGQTWDISQNLCETANAFLLKKSLKNDPDVLAYTYAGMLAGAGINSEGISLVWNSVPRLDIKVGVPTYIIIAEILRQKKMGDALTAIFRAQRAGCFNFLIADHEDIYNVEATPNDVDISYSDSYFAHTNHYTSHKFKDKQSIADVAKEYSASTILRQNKMNRMLKENYGDIDLEKCKDFMRDHLNHPESICRHPDPKIASEKRIITCSSFVIIPSQKEIWITNGPACENEFHKYVI